MAPPRRRVRTPAHSSGGGRLASLLFGVGCLVVLGVTFALGVTAGRRWPTGLPLPGLRETLAATTSALGERDTSRRHEGRGLDKDRTRPPTETAPLLTFYRELTAPLTSPPPATRTAAKPERVEIPKPAESAEATESPRPEGAPAAKAVGEGRLTVQVGAFKVSAPAEALRARLAESGQDAYVAEVEIGGVTQYRVRVGSFTTREAATEAAARLASEWRLATYVTTR
jgi:septal ring-binding cell division protein DamX